MSFLHAMTNNVDYEAIRAARIAENKRRLKARPAKKTLSDRKTGNEYRLNQIYGLLKGLFLLSRRKSEFYRRYQSWRRALKLK